MSGHSGQTWDQDQGEGLGDHLWQTIKDHQTIKDRFQHKFFSIEKIYIKSHRTSKLQINLIWTRLLAFGIIMAFVIKSFSVTKFGSKTKLIPIIHIFRDNLFKIFYPIIERKNQKTSDSFVVIAGGQSLWLHAFCRMIAIDDNHSVATLTTLVFVAVLAILSLK